MSEKFNQDFFKSPQEAVAQMSDVYPNFSSFYMPEEHAKRLESEAKKLKSDIKEIEARLLSDEVLSRMVGETVLRAMNIGVWQPSTGEGSDERIDFVSRFNGNNLDNQESIEKVDRSGYRQALIEKRKQQDTDFLRPIEESNKLRNIEADVENENVRELLSKTIDIKTITPEENNKLSTDFSTGNFLYHGTTSSQLVKIFESGNLASAKTIRDRNSLQEGGSKIVKNNSGFEGVSWSMNGIDALPGDRYHLAGFLAAPENIIGANEQLAVPSRPAPNEVLQLSSEINANEFYKAKTQYELFRDSAIISENNSAYDNLLALKCWENEDIRKFRSEPMLYKAKEGLLSSPDCEVKLRQYYTIDNDGEIELNPNLLQQSTNEIPVAAVWLQAAIDKGSFKDTKIDNMSVKEIIDYIHGDNINVLITYLKNDFKKIESIINDAESKMGNISIPIEKMYFVTSRRDADVWIKYIASCEHKPAGILLYDEDEVRLENFASSHRGDHAILTREIKSAIKPTERYIDYSKVLGADFNDEMRAGNKGQVIGEQYLKDRKAIKNVDGELVIE